MRQHIAVVDDDQSVCKGVSRLLRSAGYGTSVFASAEECLRSPDIANVDCFLLDIHLSGVSGLTLARMLREAGIVVPVIFMTAEDESRTRDALRDAGSPLCLGKPMDSATLLDAIADALARGVQ
jgi:FixJ family two-component response regulator